MCARLLKKLSVLSALLLVISGCASMSETRKRDLNRMADNTLAKVVLEQPGLQGELAVSAGYIVIERSGSGLPMVGKRGEGVLVENGNNERTFIRVDKLEVDGAWGVGDYYAIMTLKAASAVTLAKTDGLTLEHEGTIYIYVKGEGSAAYPVKVITLAPKKS